MLNNALGGGHAHRHIHILINTHTLFQMPCNQCGRPVTELVATIRVDNTTGAYFLDDMLQMQMEDHVVGLVLQAKNQDQSL